MKLCIVGTGYVGLVSAACFAEMGNTVRCVDVNPDVVRRLEAGHVHIFEPGLEPLVRRNHADGRLSFTTSLEHGLEDAEFAFICVGTVLIAQSGMSSHDDVAEGATAKIGSAS